MKVLLINPSQKAVYGTIGAINHPHMGLAYIAAILRDQGIQVVLLDMDFDRLSRQSLDALLRDKEIQLVGLTATTPVFAQAVEISGIAKRANPSLKVVVGGIHATVFPDSFAEARDVDFLVRGEGEATIATLIKALRTGNDVRRIAGISYRQGDTLHHNPPATLIANLDDLPFPVRDILSSRQYRYPGTRRYPAFAMYTSRGCYGNCTFCQAKDIYGYTVRFRSPRLVAEEIQLLRDQFGTAEIHIWDDNFAACKERVFEIRDELARRKLSVPLAFQAGIRVDTATDENVLRAMRQMGGYSIAFGIESGNQSVLDSVCKGIQLDQARRAVLLAKKVGFRVWGFFMLGFPEDSQKTMQETIDFAKELDPHIAKFHVVKPYPGSKIFEELKGQNLIFDYSFEHYGIHTFPVHNTRYVKAHTIAEYQRRAYRQFYLRPRILLRQLLWLNSTARVCDNLATVWRMLRLISIRKQAR